MKAAAITFEVTEFHNSLQTNGTERKKEILSLVLPTFFLNSSNSQSYLVSFQTSTKPETQFGDDVATM